VVAVAVGVGVGVVVVVVVVVVVAVVVGVVVVVAVVVAVAVGVVVTKIKKGKTMDINKLTVGEIREIQNLGVVGDRSSSLQVGEKYFVRTVTYHYTGRIAKITPTDIVLDDAAWIADSGRFAKALESGELSEVEPFPGRCIISRAAIVDASPWHHDLPRETK
jgi:hypothetical protein